MGTELVGPFVKEDCMETSMIPPGFESLVPITLSKAEDYQVSNSSLSIAVESHQFKLETSVDLKDDSRIVKPQRRRRGIMFSNFDNSSDDDYESDQLTFSSHQLPKGVIRGCEACSNCQKVVAKWLPKEARRPDLEEAPVFYPSEEEFEDTLKYISSIRVKAEKYGICRIVPPPSWKPPCPLKEKNVWEVSQFTTRVQQIDKLQNRNSMKKTVHDKYNKQRKKRRCLKNGVDSQSSDEEIEDADEIEHCEAERFGFEPGPEFTLDAFQKYADYFMKHYFRQHSNSELACDHETPEHWKPSLEEIEGEYWRMVEKPTDIVEVLYGADIETGAFGSGFPKNPRQLRTVSDTNYINSGWNLNNFPRLPGSVLSYESSDISGVLVPWMYIGMCFSSFCWHVEDHHLYSLNYMHWGAPKMWYGVPGSDAVKLEAAMRKNLPDLFDEQPDLLHKLVTQISPSILKAEGIRVYRCAQNPGEFVLTFPRAYHAGFNCGFNCAEAVNVAPVDWLPHGQNAIELYRGQCRKTSISHDKLLLGAAREAVKEHWEYIFLRKFTSNNLRWKDVCGKGGLLSKALKTRVELERKHREFLCKSSQALKMESSFDANSERECSICYFDLHISAAGCHHCSPNKYACLNHAKELCSCSWGSKFYLFRYDITELNILVEALEGKLSSVYRWARLDLGLALSSYISKDNMQVPGLQGKSSCNSQGSVAASLKEQKGLVVGGTPDSKNDICSSNAKKLNPSGLGNEKASASSSFLNVETAYHSSPSKSEHFLQQVRLSNDSLQSSRGSRPDKRNLVSYNPERDQSSLPGMKDVMILSDDEEDGLNNKILAETKTSEKGFVISQENVCCKTSSSLEKLSTLTSVCASAQVKAECDVAAEGDLGTDSSKNSILKILADSTNGFLIKKESLSINDANEDVDQKSQQMDEEKSCFEGNEIAVVETEPRPMQCTQKASCSPPLSQNVLDRYYCQKGPRMAKVVRRFNCKVEPLDFGSVHAGKLWCDRRAIYPKGFRSRVRYMDVLDPTKMCNYISQILDVGRDEPLFMVYVEDNPSEVFAHVSAARCWDMVRERVNQEITKQHKLGKANLPPLQHPWSLDGIEMFGFLSPTIVQAIQAMDQQRTCSEYWKSRPLMQISEQSQCAVKSEPLCDQGAWERRPGIENVLSGLFNKANPDELHMLYSLLHKNSSDDLSFLVRLLKKEIDQKPR